MSKVDIIIKIKGSATQLGMRVIQLDIVREVNRIPYAELSLTDGDVAKQSFELSNQYFELGDEVEIQLKPLNPPQGASANPVTLFKGMVSKHAVEMDAAGLSAGSRLTVELRSYLLLLTARRAGRVYQNMTDTQIVQQLLQTYGLASGTFADTAFAHTEMVQYDCTDWDFILARAEANGLCLLTEVDAQGQEILHLVPPQLNATANHTVQPGMATSVMGLEMEARLEGQFDVLQATAWDSATQQMLTPVQAADFPLAQGNMKPADAAAVLGAANALTQAPVEINPAELQRWADAILVKSRMAMLRGRLTMEGDAKYKLFELVALKSIGDRFNGNALITGIYQQISARGWTTSLQLGGDEAWHINREGVSGQAASGRLPYVHGLHTGILQGYDSQTGLNLLAKVQVSALESGQDIIWARLAMPYAGPGRGFFFRPEIGDEVLLGFLNDDPNQPVILGSLYSGANIPPDPNLQPANDYKSLIGRTGTGFVIEEPQDGKMTITAAPQSGSPQTIVLDPKGQSVTISDGNQNEIVMDAQGIKISSPKKIILKGASIDMN
ncbi:MAG: type VI secretion system tip protein VgrG [Saprospiraceae bacterium]|nr:type VI secretion system tip protein VgrG [Saprospiraceae bacterium]